MNTKPPREKEPKVQRSVIVRLSRLGIHLERRNVASFAVEDGIHARRWIRCARAGQSDTYGWSVGPARHWEVEIKAKGNRPTPLQLAWLKRCFREGCVAYWGDNCNTIERVAEAILAGGEIAWHDNDDFDVRMRS